MSTLSRQKILDAAMSIADAEGADAITMRRVATEVGARTPMALYRYVGSKDGLVDLMLDAVYGEVALPEPSGEWRADVEALALATWRTVTGHLWFGKLIHTRPPFGPNALRYFDFRFGVLERAGVGPDMASRITAAVDGHIFGAALQLAEEHAMRSRIGNPTDAQLKSTARPLLDTLLEAGQHRAFTRWFHAHDPNVLQDNVEYTLSCLLDGFAARQQ
ncbi:TetR/AcrR family transcriptional regulator [Nocardia sp. BMG111209]|uniref:TetR/AcrR family transcriptional regulator n=1 Tax=Nocardia sp. BMG111209 TaxID=1160137 RepID=UPI000364E85B|nr:TetR/AcrR family transcriptional regulator [Nocardia sp. BMG111209]